MEYIKKTYSINKSKDYTNKEWLSLLDGKYAYDKNLGMTSSIWDEYSSIIPIVKDKNGNKILRFKNLLKHYYWIKNTFIPSCKIYRICLRNSEKTLIAVSNYKYDDVFEEEFKNISENDLIDDYNTDDLTVGSLVCFTTYKKQITDIYITFDKLRGLYTNIKDLLNGNIEYNGDEIPYIDFDIFISTKTSDIGMFSPYDIEKENNNVKFERRPYKLEIGTPINDTNIESSTITATAPSMLSELKRNKVTIDDSGNALDYIFNGAEEKGYGELPYCVGYNVVSIFYDGDQEKKYTVNALTRISIKDTNENIINEWNYNDVKNKSDNTYFVVTPSTSLTIGDTVIIEFEYLINGILTNIIEKDKDGNKKIIGSTIDGGVKYVDRNKYSIEEDKNVIIEGTLRNIKYFKFVENIVDGLIINDGYTEGRNLNLSKIKYKDNGKNLDNLFDTLPYIKQDDLIGIEEYTKTIDINVERGSSAAYERHMALTEIKNFDELKRYRNGGFLVMSDDE